MLKRYEGMFLFDTAVTRDWAGIEEEVRRLCERIGAELLACVKFDERKLAYEINRRKRGTYVLTYFDAPSDRITDLERDVRLSEVVLRVLVLRAEQITAERLAELRAHPADTPLAPLSGDGRRHDDDRRRGAPYSERTREAKEPTPATEERPRPAASPVPAEPAVPTSPPSAEVTAATPDEPTAPEAVT